MYVKIADEIAGADLDQTGPVETVKLIIANLLLYTVSASISALLLSDITIQSNFNGSNIYGTMKISLRQG